MLETGRTVAWSCSDSGELISLLMWLSGHKHFPQQTARTSCSRSFIARSAIASIPAARPTPLCAHRRLLQVKRDGVWQSAKISALRQKAAAEANIVIDRNARKGDESACVAMAKLLHEPSAQAGKFAIANRACFFKPIKLVDFICGAKADNTPQFIARLSRLLKRCARPSLFPERSNRQARRGMGTRPRLSPR